MNNEKEKSQQTINASEAERQLPSVGNNFKETDEVAKDGYIFRSSDVEMMEEHLFIPFEETGLQSISKNPKVLKSFFDKLQIVFGEREGMKIENVYYNAEPKSRDLLWLCKSMSDLSISELSLFVINGKVNIKSFKYELDPTGIEGLGSRYNLELFDDNAEFMPKNIKRFSLIYDFTKENM